MTIRRRILLVLLVILSVIGFWLLNVSKPGQPHGCPQGCASRPVPEEGPLRVLSLNMLHGRPDFENLTQRLDIIAEAILALDADIVLLQEVPWVPGIGEAAASLAERCGMNYLYLRANGNRWAIFFEEGSAILSRFPLTSASYAELRPQAALFEHRIVLHATAITHWGDVDLFVTHLTDGEDEINAAQLDSLQAWVSTTGDAPAIIGGDFNAREDEAHIQTLEGEWIDAHRAANPGQPGLTCCVDDLHANPDEPLEKRIDYIFLLSRGGSETLVVRADTVLHQPVGLNGGWQWASDHVGLFVEIEIGR